MRKHPPKPVKVTIMLDVGASPYPLCVAMKWVLKTLLRCYRMRCTSMHWTEPETAGQDKGEGTP